MDRKLIGEYIKILKGNGNVSIGSIDRVRDIVDNQVYGENWHLGEVKEDDYKIIPNPLFQFKIDVGSEIVLKRDYANLKNGQTLIVEGYLNDDSNKIVVKGINPGGWINRTDINSKIDISQFRMMTFLESCLEFGSSWYLFSNICNISKTKPYFGQPLTYIEKKAGIVTNSSNLIIGSAKVASIFLVDVNKPIPQIRVIGKSKEETAKTNQHITNIISGKELKDITFFDCPFSTARLTPEQIAIEMAINWGNFIVRGKIEGIAALHSFNVNLQMFDLIVE